MIATIKKMIKEIRSIHMVCFLLFSSLSIVSYQYVRLVQDFKQFKWLHGKSVYLMMKADQIEHSLASIDQTLNRINQFSGKLKVIARVKDALEGTHLAKDKKKTNKKVSKVKELNEQELEKIQKKVNDLRSEAEIQEEYISDLSGFFEENKTLLASVPSRKPSEGYITSRFGFRKTPLGQWRMHKGVDLAANYGTKIVSPADGLVEDAGYSPGYGRYVVLDHGFGIKTLFAHASKLMVKAGEFVKQGTKIAQVGRSGHARGVHLHYEVRLDDVPLDPIDFIF